MTNITITQSISDWWGTLSTLMKPTVDSKSYHEARYKNLMIEYELYKAILSEDIQINKPFESVYSTGLIGSFVDSELDNGDVIHEFLLENIPKDENKDPQDIQHIVIIHGYMAASGYFVKTFETLIKSKKWLKIHVIDLPGFGNSSRPKFPKELLKDYTDKFDKINQVLNIENWFIDRIELWRIKNSLTHFKLISHSMGGYLSCCYLMKYNMNQVKDLIIVSPMGTESSSMSLIHDKNLQVNHHELGSDPLRELITAQPLNEEINPELEKLWEKLGRPKFPKNIVLKKLWEWKISPFQLLQLFGPLFSKFLSFWSFQRFKNLTSNEDDQGDNHDLILKLHYYSYSIFNQFQGSGELAITKLINHEILPRLPLGERKLSQFFTDNQIRTLWLYGDKDWMNDKGGMAISEEINQLGGESTFEMVPDAGHHIYLDNPEEFNKLVIDFFHLDNE